MDEIEGHLRALLRDVLCGYLDADLKSVADDILLESPEPFAIQARDMRVEPEPSTEEFEVAAAPVRHLGGRGVAPGGAGGGAGTGAGARA